MMLVLWIAACTSELEPPTTVPPTDAEAGPGCESPGEWLADEAPPDPLEGAGAAADAETMWLSGGWDGIAVRTEVLKRGIDGGAWQPVASLPEPREHHAMTTWDGVVYVAGGDDGPVHGDVWSLDDGEWRVEPSLPAPRTFPAFARSDRGHWYVLGGLDGAASTSVHRADLSAGSIVWVAETELPAPMFAAAAVIWDQQLWVLGGAESMATVTDAVWIAEIATDGSLGPWIAGPPLPRPSLGHVAGVSEGGVLVAGGFDWVDAFKKTWWLQDDAWVSATALPDKTFSSASAQSGSQLRIVGGWVGAFASIQPVASRLELCPSD